ncbi:MAG: TrkA family potassium uptake protein [Rubrobacteraceae bacterium]
MSRQFVIIGLGRLGTAMLRTLDSLGHEVLGIDTDERRIQDLADEFPNAHLVAADATDEVVLEGLNVGKFDGAAVVIGENMEAGILATANLKELGVPSVTSRALSRLHARVLEKIGADRIVQPEREMGRQLARTMASPAILEYLDLGEDEALLEIETPEQWVGQTLVDLQLARKLGLTVVALKPREGGGTIPRGDTELGRGDVLVIGGPKKNLDRLDLLRG